MIQFMNIQIFLKRKLRCFNNRSFPLDIRGQRRPMMKEIILIKRLIGGSYSLTMSSQVGK